MFCYAEAILFSEMKRKSLALFPFLVNNVIDAIWIVIENLFFLFKGGI